MDLTSLNNLKGMIRPLHQVGEFFKTQHFGQVNTIQLRMKYFEKYHFLACDL